MESQSDTRKGINSDGCGRPVAGFVMLLSTVLLFMMLVTGEKWSILFAFTALFWLVLLLVGLAIVITNTVLLFYHPKERYHRIIVIWGAVNILLFAGVGVRYAHKSKLVDAEHMIAYYEEHEAEIWDLAEYTRSAIDSGTWLRLEFDGDKVEMFHTRTAHGTDFNWSENDKQSLDAESIGKYIGLTHSEIEGIRQRMKAAGCISIELTNHGSSNAIISHGETYNADEFDRVTIGYKRHFMSMYLYVLNRYPMSDSTWNHMLHSDVARIPICDTMSLEYGSPAFGDDRYPNRDKVIKRLNIKER